MESAKTIKTNTGVKQKRGMAASLRGLFTLAVIATSSPAWCQLNAITTKVNTFSTWLYAIAGVVFTIGFMWCGFKMLKRGEGWDDVKNVAIGAFIVGAAAGLGGWAVS